MARRFSRPRASTPRRPTIWGSTTGIDGQPGPLAAGGLAISSVAGNVGSQKIFIGSVQPTDFTVIRSRGIWNMQFDGSPAGDADAVLFGFAMGVVSEQAALSGTVPAVIEQADWDGWFIYETQILGGSGTGAGDPLQTHSALMIDSKAMRKVQTGSVIFASFQTYRIAGSIALTGNASAFFRQLAKVN